MKRIQRKRTKGWRMPPGAVYVGRPTMWGNLYSGGKIPEWRAVDLYRINLGRMIADGVLRPDYFDRLRNATALACWCPLDQPCHADVLIELLR